MVLHRNFKSSIVGGIKGSPQKGDESYYVKGGLL